MRVIAIQNFHPPGLPRPIRPGETLDVDDDLAHAWLGQGLVLAPDDEARTDEQAGEAEQAIAAPAEAPAAAPKEKPTRKPRENAARRKR